MGRANTFDANLCSPVADSLVSIDQFEIVMEPTFTPLLKLQVKPHFCGVTRQQEYFSAGYLISNTFELTS
jgi:hypothetical protein